MDKRYDHIQLPPLPVDMDANSVGILWEYIKMPPENQRRKECYPDPEGGEEFPGDPVAGSQVPGRISDQDGIRVRQIRLFHVIEGL